jgi:hypothetical protein
MWNCVWQLDNGVAVLSNIVGAKVTELRTSWFLLWDLVTDGWLLCVLWQTELTHSRPHLQKIHSEQEMGSNGLHLGRLPCCKRSTDPTQRTCETELTDAPLHLSHSCLQSSLTCKSVLISGQLCLKVFLWRQLSMTVFRRPWECQDCLYTVILISNKSFDFQLKILLLRSRKKRSCCRLVAQQTLSHSFQRRFNVAEKVIIHWSNNTSWHSHGPRHVITVADCRTQGSERLITEFTNGHDSVPVPFTSHHKLPSALQLDLSSNIYPMGFAQILCNARPVLHCWFTTHCSPVTVRGLRKLNKLQLLNVSMFSAPTLVSLSWCNQNFRRLRTSLFSQHQNQHN